MTLENKIDRFWKWFAQNEGDVVRAVDDEILAESIVEQLDNFILDMGAFSWEIGAGIEKNWFLTISPNENRDLLSISRQIMGHAPDLQHWEFNDSKPPKNWDRKFTLYDELMDERAIDASAWKFAVIEGEYGKVDVILEADNIQHLDYETTLTAGNLLVLGELGEELKIKKIGTIEVVQSLGQEYKEDKFDIADLREHFRSI